MLRTIRIIAVATFLATLFRLSQTIGAAKGNESVAGYNVALGVVSLLFFVRAAASEFASSNVSPAQRDILWGVSLGTFVSILASLLR
ncbi:MAG TPA: hypothetical protein VGK20_15955 [Candidatus Binatia bacterium]|jgi:hypothetical protein